MAPARGGPARARRAGRRATRAGAAQEWTEKEPKRLSLKKLEALGAPGPLVGALAEDCEGCPPPLELAP